MAMAMANANYCGLVGLCCISILIVGHHELGVEGSVPNVDLGGKKLIVSVPYKTGFTEFVHVELNPNNIKAKPEKVTGYCIDIFNATIEYISNHFNYNVDYEFRPFIKETSGQIITVSYDDLVRQVYDDKKFDMVVGDVSIVASRSKYVDFTLPFVESGVRMLVRVGYARHLNMWIFLQPFSWDLWLSIALASAFIGATIQFMERRNIDDNNNKPNRISIVWLPLAQVVLPQGESVGKSWSKFVLVVWLILAFVLMQSYTASLSSILTVNQLQSSYPSVSDLKGNGENIGYATGSWMVNMLVGKWGFDKSKVIEISNMEDYKKALDKGSSKGGVAVIFDEIPYIKMFLKRYGSNYKMVGPHYRTDGLGFAFPIHSNLTSYFSSAILNVTQSSELMEPIERKYFGRTDMDLLDDESDQLSSDNPSSSLTTQSFAGLFMITGIATVLALAVSEGRDIWRKHVALARVYSHNWLLSPLRTKSNQSVDVSTTGGNESSSNSEPN